MTTHNRNSYVGILTHEGPKQHEQTNVGMLTQFFLDNNNVATGVKTFVIDNARYEAVRLAEADNYSKKLCNVPHLMNLEYTPTSVMFILCHGSKKSDIYKTPCYLNFSEDADRNILYPCSGFSQTIWLHHVIKNTKLFFLMCCNCDQIVPAYLAERSNDFPDIVYYNCGLVMQVTHAIFVAWLIKIMDSDEAIGCNPTAEELHAGVKESVMKIMFMVQQCADKDTFFDNLIEWGCISKYTTEKEKEQQALPDWRFNDPTCMQKFYRVYGHTKNEWLLGNEKELLFKEFQALTLVERGDTTPVYKTHRDFTAKPNELRFPREEPSLITDKSGMDLRMLLCRMKRLG